MTSDQTATYMDHHQLNFWLWACLRDGEAYLAASAAFGAILRTAGADIRTFHERRMTAQREMELAKYHFLTATGSLLRNLKRSQNLFPNIKPACNRAQHLFAEGKLLRDMIEHADAYFEGKGREQAGFIREAVGVATRLARKRSWNR
jgi:hypothetical protein